MKPLSKQQAGLPADQLGHYRVNEMFYSVQGEGALVGTPMVFVRLSKCNLRCSAFNEAGQLLSVAEIHNAATSRDMLGRAPAGDWMLLTGGEPGLQIDSQLIDGLKSLGWKLAVETNGTIKLPEGLDWICVSPKTAEHTIRQRTCDELKVVRGHGQELPELANVTAAQRFVSPAFGPDGRLSPRDAQWCVRLALRTPGWRLSLQTHKFLGVR